ncbi:glucose-induced degradation protein 8 like protein [Ditylenchus destructor]|nr:glucose-induced degradation protein 8 like protein [Ditylenchus destructor]
MADQRMDYEAYDDDDVFRYLPTLKNESSPRDVVVDEFEGDQNWYNNFMSSVSDDVDPQKLHELVLDYLVCSGYQEAAELLCAEMKYPKENVPNVESLEQRNNIRNAIVSGELECALSQIEELAPNLLEQNGQLHFKLLRQQLIELIRKKDIDKVLSFAQDHLVDKCEQPPELFTKLEQTYALLAFDNPENSPFGYLMSLNQRNMLANEVNSVILAFLNKNSTSKLEKLFKMIIWSQNQHMTKGEALRPLSQDVTSQISKDLFGAEDDPCSDML